MRGAGTGHKVAVAVVPGRMDTAIALIRRRGVVVAALLTLALLSYSLMVLFPQQVEPLTASPFMSGRP